MCKEYVLLRDQILPNHSMFKGYTDEQKQRVLANPKAFNVEYLVEQVLAELGSYKHTDADHSDYSDGSDCKTASVAQKKSSRTTANLFDVTIFGVAKNTKKGFTYKTGDIRAVVYNPFTDNTMLYFFPKAWWVNHVKFHSTQGWGYFRASYNKKTDCITNWEQFRCKTIRELAKMKSTI